MNIEEYFAMLHKMAAQDRQSKHYPSQKERDESEESSSDEAGFVRF